jgi:hypothetical protein
MLNLSTDYDRPFKFLFTFKKYVADNGKEYFIPENAATNITMSRSNPNGVHKQYLNLLESIPDNITPNQIYQKLKKNENYMKVANKYLSETNNQKKFINAFEELVSIIKSDLVGSKLKIKNIIIQPKNQKIKKIKADQNIKKQLSNHPIKKWITKRFF